MFFIVSYSSANRRTYFQNTSELADAPFSTNPLSIGNMERLTSTDPGCREFFKNLNTDPEYVKVALGRGMEGAMPESFEVTPMTNGSK